MNYKVYQGTELKQTVTDKIAVMNGLQPNQTYDFSVEPDNVTNLLLGTTQAFSMTGTNTVNQCDWANSLINGYNASSLASKLGTQFTVSYDWSVSGSSPSGSFSAQWNDVPWNGGGIWNVTTVSSSNTSGHISNTIGVSADSKNVATTLGFRLDNFVGTITFSNLRLEKGSVATTSVTTRGIRFNIPKTLTVNSTITLRYEEYPLGIVPIGNEPSGYFGGGNKQNLSAKVISTANGSSVVEVAGNVIEVGNKNLFKNTTNLSSTTTGESWNPIFYPSQVYDSGIKSLSGVSAITFSFNVYVPSNVEVGEQCYFQLKGQNSKATDWGSDDWNTLIGGVEYAIKQDDLGKTIYLNYSIVKYYKYQSLDAALADTASIIIRQGLGTPGLVCSKPKLETGDQVTPYAAFVDGDTFTAQPDGTCALFSEHKALYY